MIAVLVAAFVSAVAPAGRTLAVDPAASTIRFHIVHKLHGVDGTTNRIEGKAVVKEDGSVLAMVRVPVATFQSGDANRDEHMLEALEVGRHPFVVFKGVAQLGADVPPTGGPVTMQGEVDLHGVKREVAVPLSLEFGDDGTVRARGAFDTSLEAHAIKRPSLLFVKIDDNCRIDVDLVLRDEKQ